MRMPILAISSARHGVGASMIEPLQRAAPLDRLAAHEEVAHDRHQRDHGEVLVDRGDAAVERVARRGEPTGWPSSSDLARARRVDAREDLDQRRLAGAVVAEQAMHLAGAHLASRCSRRAITEPKCLVTFFSSTMSRRGVISAPPVRLAADEVVEEHGDQHHRRRGTP